MCIEDIVIEPWNVAQFEGSKCNRTLVPPSTTVIGKRGIQYCWREGGERGRDKEGTPIFTSKCDYVNQW